MAICSPLALRIHLCKTLRKTHTSTPLGSSQHGKATAGRLIPKSDACLDSVAATLRGIVCHQGQSNSELSEFPQVFAIWRRSGVSFEQLIWSHALALLASRLSLPTPLHGMDTPLLLAITYHAFAWTSPRVRKPSLADSIAARASGGLEGPKTLNDQKRCCQ